MRACPARETAHGVCAPCLSLLERAAVFSLVDSVERAEFDVATLAKEISGSESKIIGEPTQPKHQIVTDKIRSVGMQFGGEQLLRKTVADLVQSIA